ncbi:hypothetical protein DSO57_1012614 [Entomophthora muscae]|nr:hypothetical protein DSO57_1012614 [Entomophthora muscae]
MLVIVVKSNDSWGLGLLDIFSLKIYKVTKRTDTKFCCLAVPILPPSQGLSNPSDLALERSLPILIGVNDGTVLLFKVVTNNQMPAGINIYEAGEIKTQLALPITHASVLLTPQQEQAFLACGFLNGLVHVYSYNNSVAPLNSEHQLLIRLRSPFKKTFIPDSDESIFSHLKFLSLVDFSADDDLCLYLAMSASINKDQTQESASMFIARIEPASREHTYLEIENPAKGDFKLVSCICSGPERALLAGVLDAETSEIQIIRCELGKQMISGCLSFINFASASKGLMDFYFDVSFRRLHFLYSDRHSELEVQAPTPRACSFSKAALLRLNYKDWFFTDIRRTPYTQQELNRLSLLRQKLGGKLYVDFLLESCRLSKGYSYPIQSIGQMESLVSACQGGDFLVEKSCLLYYLARDCIHESGRLTAFTKLIHIPLRMRIRVDGYWNFDHISSSKGVQFIIPQNCFGEGVQVQNLLEPDNFSSTIWQSWNRSRTMPLSTEMVFQALLRIDIFLAHLFRKLFIQDEKSLQSSLNDLCEFSLTDRKRSRVLLNIEFNSEDEKYLLSFFLDNQKPASKHFYLVWLSLRNRFIDVMEFYNRSQNILNHSYNVSRLTELKILLQLIERYTSLPRPISPKALTASETLPLQQSPTTL